MLRPRAGTRLRVLRVEPVCEQVHNIYRLLKTQSPQSRMPDAVRFIPHGEQACSSPIFSEPLCLLEFLALRLSPVYNGVGIPPGDGAAVIVIPGLLGMDIGLFEMYGWLKRIGYRPYYSGIVLSADCPDQLSALLDATIDRAYADTGRRVHLVGHSLGGIFARSAAVRRPKRIRSVISLGSPYRGLVMRQWVIQASKLLRGWIRRKRARVPGECGFEPLPLRLRTVTRPALAAVRPADHHVYKMRWPRRLALLPEREDGCGRRGCGDTSRPAIQRERILARGASARRPERKAGARG